MSASNAAIDLQLTVIRAEVRVGQLQLRCPTFDRQPAPQLTLAQAELHDHRVAVAGDMADALDRIQPGLGSQWMQALFPEVPRWFWGDEDKCAGAGAFAGAQADASAGAAAAANASAPTLLPAPVPAPATNSQGAPL